jgi:hypothetical protein
MNRRAFVAVTAYFILAAVALRVYVAQQTPPVVLSEPLPVADRHEPVTTDLDPGDGPLVTLPDLSTVDRSLVEPAGLRDPRYCLLVFGRRDVKARVWLVLDGETLYADRDGSGSLTDPAKAVSAVKHEQGTKDAQHRSWAYPVGDVTPGGLEKHTGLEVARYQSGDDEPIYKIYVRSFGKTLQYAAGRNLFSKDRGAAPVVHFGGPVLPKAVRYHGLSADGSEQELHFCVGTPGLGSDSFASVSIDGVPFHVHPVVRVRWPAGSPEVEDRFLLKDRC